MGSIEEVGEGSHRSESVLGAIAPFTERFEASFRDPLSYVFRRGGRIFRAIDTSTHEALRGLDARGMLRGLADEGLLVPTSFVEKEEERAALASENPGYDHFLEHASIAPVSFPYEWSVSMLAAAGVLTIDLQLRLLDVGLSLKDGSAFNVQFVGGRPCFIDLGSIEVPTRRDIWYALGQFHRMFTYPLLLCLHRGWDPRSYFLGSLDGRDAPAVARAFGWSGRLRPSLLLDLTLPAWLSAAASKPGKTETPGRSNARASADSRAQVLNLKRLRSKIIGLAASYRHGGVWSRYPSNSPYDPGAEKAKKLLVADFLGRAKPATVLDLGCNTGDFSMIAAESGARVLAVDSDHDSVDLLYRRVQQTSVRVLPLVVDLANPSPAVGYRNREREAFLERAGADCVLGLALLHHLLVTANLTLVMVRDLLASLTRSWLVLEFIPPQDRMFRDLLRFRHENFDSLTLDAFRSVFLEQFAVVAEEPICGTDRTLFLFRKRADGYGTG